MGEFLRKAIVVVGESEDGLKIQDLRIQFAVTRSIQAFPNSCELTLYNLNRNTQSKFEKEFTKLFLFAGYGDNPKLIFKGNIKNVAISSNGVDSKTTLFAGDADFSFSTATFSETFQGQSDLTVVVTRIAATFDDVTVGSLDGLDDKFLPLRGFTMDGSSVSQLNKLADSYDFDWSVDNSVFTTIGKKTTLNTEAIVVSAATGLLDVPTVTEVGVNVKTLLNPSYVPRGKIKVDTSDSQIQAQQSSIVRLPRTKANGIFPILQVVHSGDTHGQEWVSNLQTQFFL